jgi:hypothetical protein
MPIVRGFAYFVGCGVIALAVYLSIIQFWTVMDLEANRLGVHSGEAGIIIGQLIQNMFILGFGVIITTLLVAHMRDVNRNE